MEPKLGVSRLLHTLIPFMVMAAMQKGILLLCASTSLAGTDAASLLAFLPAAASAAALFRVRTYTPPAPEEESVAPLVPRPLRICLLHTAAATAALIAVMFAVSALMQGQAAPWGPAESGMRVTALTVLSLCLIHPAIEEYLFRGAFYGELRRMHPIFAILAQAVMFAIVHDTVDSMVYALGAGVILGILAERSGRLWPAVIAHILINARSLLFLTLLAENAPARRILDGALLFVGLAAFAASFVWRERNEPEADF
ncbi:MAG: CPBP family intramembrane metalloprotease [Clostridia bacterium]|nr:CPBP family intramembrane metalloprotease [Clostridia bacterium]